MNGRIAKKIRKKVFGDASIRLDGDVKTEKVRFAKRNKLGQLIKSANGVIQEFVDTVFYTRERHPLRKRYIDAKKNYMRTGLV